MNMKYFRFLFGKMGMCLLHLGEIRDTKTEEKFTFLYLRGTDGRAIENLKTRDAGVEDIKWEKSLFVCPNMIHLAVIGQNDMSTWRTLQEIMKNSSVDTLVVNGGFAIPREEVLKRVRKVVFLTQAKPVWEFNRAGWKFYVKGCGDNRAAMLHGLIERNGTDVYDDCVMSVKVMNREKRCARSQEPDSFGCALGCMLHQDYDVCKYRRKGEEYPYITGTLLLPKFLNEEERKEFMNHFESKAKEIRFYGLAGDIPKWRGNDAHKRYFVGMGTEMDNQIIADICRESLYQSPVILQEKQALCCSGMMRYAETDENTYFAT